MSRPSDWFPLADSDPFPGDPDAIAQAAQRYRDTAELIESQATQLRALAGGDVWDSEAGEVFEGHADETSNAIVKAKGRYSRVGTHLTAWSEVLVDAQRESASLLDQARDAQARIEANANSTLDGVDEPTESQQTADDRRQGRYDDAVEELGGLRGRLANLQDRVAGDAERIAGDIRDASSDDVKDGFWDKVKGFINDNVDFLKAFANVMSWIATIAGVLALVLSMTGILAPLAAVLTVVALLATAASLIVNIALAATGNGSWWAVAFDVVALVTFGVGRVAISGARAGLAATRAAAKPFAVTAALRSFVTGNRIFIAAARSMAGSRFALFRVIGRFGTGVLRFQAGIHVRAAVRTLNRAPVTSFAQRARFLDGNLAGYATRARQIALQYNYQPVVDAAAQTVRNANVGTAALGLGVVVEVANKPATDNYPWDLPENIGIVDSDLNPWW